MLSFFMTLLYGASLSVRQEVTLKIIYSTIYVQYSYNVFLLNCVLLSLEASITRQPTRHYFARLRHPKGWI